MFKNYIKIAIRNLLRHKVYSFINVAGLAIGLACFTLIMLFVQDEWNYDRYHENADDIYRVVLDVEASEGATTNAQTPPTWPELMMHEYPEIEAAVRFKPPRQTWMVEYQDQRFPEKGWAFADSTVFDVFDFELIDGDAARALNVAWQVVISESAAARYFGDEDPMGKTITIDGQYDFLVTGIYRDMPANSHFHFDFMASFVSMEDPAKLYLVDVRQVQIPFSYTYLKLREGTDPAVLEARFPQFIQQRIPPQVLQGNSITLGLQPLTRIHLYSSLENEIEPNGNETIVVIFFAVALFVLLIACINFMNLATARSANRAREVGLRKAVGAHRVHVIQQFLGESSLLALIALAFALALVAFALPQLNNLTGKSISLVALAEPRFFLTLLGTTLAAGLIAGSYPAFFLSAFRPAAVLKGTYNRGHSGQTALRKGLIVFQFGISLVLIIGTLVVYQQMDYIRNKGLGFDKEQIVVVQVTDPIPSKRFPAFREAILRHPSILQVSSSQSIPGGLMQQVQLRPAGANTDQRWQLQAFIRDYDVIETMGMELVAGRDYSRERPSDTLGTVILNEAAVRSMGWQDPQEAVDQPVEFANGGPPLRIMGVVKDFHSQSVHEQIAPLAMFFSSFRFFGLVRIAPNNINAAIETMRAEWGRILPSYTFTYSFLDDDFAKLYQQEAVLGTLLAFFAILTVLIACLGLFGLASFTTEQRTKEVGVRKVLGATVPQIVLMLSRDVTTLVVLAFVVAAPLAYYLMDTWLQSFAYHIDMPFQVFALSGVMALFIAWATVSYQSIKAAMVNPVNSLRYE